MVVAQQSWRPAGKKVIRVYKAPAQALNQRTSDASKRSLVTLSDSDSHLENGTDFALLILVHFSRLKPSGQATAE